MKMSKMATIYLVYRRPDWCDSLWLDPVEAEKQAGIVKGYVIPRTLSGDDIVWTIRQKGE